MEINFHITKAKFDALTWDEYIAIEGLSDSTVSLVGLKQIAARFMVDEKKMPIGDKQAQSMLGKLTVPQIKTALIALNQALTDYSAPKETGSEST